jgi:hypothetical protein
MTGAAGPHAFLGHGEAHTRRDRRSAKILVRGMLEILLSSATMPW